MAANADESRIYRCSLKQKLLTADLHFLNKQVRVGDCGKTTASAVHRAQLCAAVAAVAVCSRKKFRLHVCSASCSCYEVSSLSYRAAHVSRASAEGYYTLGTVSHGVLSAFYEHVCTYTRRVPGPTITGDFHHCDATKRATWQLARERNISCSHI